LPARVQVYCRRPVTLTVGALRQLVADTDWETLAEHDDLDDDVIAASLPVRVAAGDDAAPCWTADLEYGQGRRSIQLSYDDEPAVIAERLEELEELLDEHHPDMADQLLERLAPTVADFGFEMGLDQPADLGGLIAAVVAFWIAEAGDGLIDFYGDEWYAASDRNRPLSRRD